MIDDPNSHLEAKIKRIVSGSISGLDLNDVTVISDWSRFTDVKPEASMDMLGQTPQDYISIWSIILTKNSVPRFRTIFFSLLVFAILFALSAGWMIWKFYPLLRHHGMKEFFSPTPLAAPENEPEEG